MFASYVCTEQKLLFYSFSLLDVIYKEILQVWYFMVSTTVRFLYLQTLFKKEKEEKKILDIEPFFFSVIPKGFL